MGASRELRARIDSVEETRKITNAMRLIATARLRWAAGKLEGTAPYFRALREQMLPAIRSGCGGEEDKNEKEAPSGPPGLLVIGAERGMAGAFNTNVMQEALGIWKRSPETRIFVVGDRGRRFLQSRGVPVEAEGCFPGGRPDMAQARRICTLLLDRFDRGEIGALRLLYTHMKTRLDLELCSSQLLPLTGAGDGEARTETAFEFVPGRGAVLEDLIPAVLSGYVYCALLSSYGAEQSARVQAMESATRNADALLDKLELALRRERQAAVTREITEVSAGALARRQETES